MMHLFVRNRSRSIGIFDTVYLIVVVVVVVVVVRVQSPVRA